MDKLRKGQVLFRVHAPEQDDAVDAAVFAAKLGVLVRALKSADKAANKGLSAHTYTIAKLHNSSPTVILNEEPRRSFQPPFPLLSGIPAFDRCVDALRLGITKPEVTEYRATISHIESLAKGADHQFGYAEVWTDNDTVIRVDPFLRERAHAAISEDKKRRELPSTWFKGHVFGTFEGYLKEVDLRGASPQIKLTLSAGGKEIDCVCRQDHLERIKANLDERVRISGRAFYDGKTGLPRRVEVSNIQDVPGAKDVTKWRGAFRPFEIPEWIEDSD